MRHLFIVFILLLGSMTTSAAQVSINIGSPNLQIGVNVSDYPDLVAIPGYPVYYAPRMDSNYFFYDGLYWVYQEDNWYASSWYNGPWSFVDPYVVPVYVLRVPVRYYRRPPVYFRHWSVSSAPRWGDHWGHDWQEHRHGWDNWNHRSAPKRLPLPIYQRQYSGNRYPDSDHQRDLQREHYRYQPRNTVIAQYYKSEREQNDQWRTRNQRQDEHEAHSVNERHQQIQREEQQQKAHREEDQRQQNRRQQEQQQLNRREEDQRQQPHRQQEQAQQNEQRQQQVRQQEQQRQEAKQQEQLQVQERQAEPQRQNDAKKEQLHNRDNQSKRKVRPDNDKSDKENDKDVQK